MSAEESVVAFGPDKTLIGILTPAASTAEPARLGCLLLNTGVNHRVGPRRMNVKIARQLAAAGIPCLRFDMTGVGDSKASSGREDYQQQQLKDMHAALDQFQASTGLTRFVAFGVCSGAASALRIALADKRIVGTLMFDGFDFPDIAARLERKLRRCLAFPFNASLRRTNPAWRDWSEWASSPLDATARDRFLARWRKSGDQQEHEGDIFSSGIAPYGPGQFAADLQLLLDRGVDVYAMFSAMVHVNDGEKHRKMLSRLRGHPSLQRIRYRFWPDMDHTATLVQTQKRLIDEIEQWARAVAEGQSVARAPAAEAPSMSPMPPPRVQVLGRVDP